MTISHLPESGYETMPWKNGTGSTDEICLRPAGASRDRFDLRVSRAVISVPGPFSAFPGVDRTITLIEGGGLELDFGDRSVELRFAEPYSFNSGLTPVGTPADGGVRVVNVMAARDAWRLAPARILTGETPLRPDPGGMIVVFVIRGTAGLSEAEKSVSLTEGDTALLDDAADLHPAAGAAVLCVPLCRAPVA